MWTIVNLGGWQSYDDFRTLSGAGQNLGHFKKYDKVLVKVSSDPFRLETPGSLLLVGAGGQNLGHL